VTLYAYDTLNNLTCAVQKGTDTATFTTCAAAPATWRPRSFVYDSLSRLTSATNPESGTITYTYDANSNVATKVAPKPNKIPADTSSPQTVTTSFFYDVLNRLTKKTYSDGTAQVQYGYDGVAPSGCTFTVPTLSDTNPIGRRTSMCDGSGATHWALDITAGTGWKTTEARKIGSLTKNIVTQNNLGGMTYQLTYPGGHVITYTPNGSTGTAGRYASAVDSAISVNYVQNATYAPFGALTGMTNGAAPITVTNAYNERLQPATLSAATAANTLFSRTYDFHRANGDNGNVYQELNNLDNARNQSFTYDALNRIATAQSAATSGTKCWGESFTVDAWSNLTNKTVTKCTAETLNAPATTKNQISGYCYDKAGDLLGTSGCPGLPYTPTYTYDAENRLLTAGGVTYTYDGDGNRVKKPNGTLYWGSGPLAESDLSGNIQRSYIFFNGQRIARRDVSNNSVHYYYSDHLGSHSVIANSSGTLPLEEDLDYYPYGGIAGGTASDHYEFTGKERDSESGLDNFGARYYSSSLGRFVSIDPAYKSEILELPQTFNRYSYVYNRPTFATDPDGRCPPCVGALVGGALGGVWNLGSQLYHNGGHISQVSGREVLANIAGGAVSGAIAGATGGTSLLLTAAGSAVGDVAGGIVTRTAEGKSTDEIFDTDEMEEEAVSGFLGGAAGHLASGFIHPPGEPELPGPRRHAVGRRKLAKYDAAVRNNRNMEMLHTAVDVGVGNNASNAGRRGFWSSLDWFSTPPPPTTPGPPENPHSTTRIIDCHDMRGVPCQ
jgi:RHS repeat-associated protein